MYTLWGEGRDCLGEGCGETDLGEGEGMLRGERERR